MQCSVCSKPAEYACGDCLIALYCSESCQTTDLTANQHVLICARPPDKKALDKWDAELGRLGGDGLGGSVRIRDYNTLVEVFRGPGSPLSLVPLLNVVRAIRGGTGSLAEFERNTLDKLATLVVDVIDETFIEDRSISRIQSEVERTYLLQNLLPRLLDILKELCSKDVPICTDVGKLRKRISKAKTASSAKAPKPVDLNALWQRECTGLDAPWYGNAFHLLGANKAIGKFICRMTLGPAAGAEFDLLERILVQLRAAPGGGALAGILPDRIDHLIRRRREGRLENIIEFEPIFRKLMKTPGGQKLINSKFGLHPFGMSIGPAKTVPEPSKQLTRSLDLNDFAERLGAGQQPSKSAINLMRRGYKIGEFICRMRLIAMQNEDWDLIVTIVQGIQSYLDSLSVLNPIRVAGNLVLFNGNYLTRRLGRAQPPLESLEDLNSIFEKIQPVMLSFMPGQLTPYGLTVK